MISRTARYKTDRPVEPLVTKTACVDIFVPLISLRLSVGIVRLRTQAMEFSLVYKPPIGPTARAVLRPVAERRTIDVSPTVVGVLCYVTVFTRVTMEMHVTSPLPALPLSRSQDDTERTPLRLSRQCCVYLVARRLADSFVA
jgi:hypothetical protein